MTDFDPVEFYRMQHEIAHPGYGEPSVDPAVLRALAIEIERRTHHKCTNWLRRQANAEQNADKRAAFIEAYNALAGKKEEGNG